MMYTNITVFINILGKEADFAAWSEMFWARILEGKLPRCDEDEDEGKKGKKGCGSGGTCCSEKKKKIAEDAVVNFALVETH